MPIIEIVGGQGEAAPQSLSRRLGWFVLIWIASTAAIFLAAGAIRLLVPH
ncbi:DUF2474 family protein [Brytella acorum]|uniref:DUF2474 family protein n=1 Tax=Brytella acorum TaxID=2959299 RepID=A0AA35Y2Y0_9PROT|nr:DUF2474 family protein [Brytella acorum]MDF3625143.1 DUF2474 family protein [Brytella acorum]CAI9122043.1 DUF2474 family protein [Brytella acorum]